MKAYDHNSIESRIQEARRLRSEATGDLMAAAWQRAKNLVARVFARHALAKSGRSAR